MKYRTIILTFLCFFILNSTLKAQNRCSWHLQRTLQKSKEVKVKPISPGELRLEKNSLIMKKFLVHFPTQAAETLTKDEREVLSGLINVSKDLQELSGFQKRKDKSAEVMSQVQKGAEILFQLYIKEGYLLGPIHSINPQESLHQMQEKINAAETQLRDLVQSIQPNSPRDPELTEELERRFKKIIQLKSELDKQMHSFIQDSINLGGGDLLGFEVLDSHIPQQQKILRNLQDKYGLNKIIVTVDSKMLTGMSQVMGQTDTQISNIYLSAVSNLFPRFFLRGSTLLHEVVHLAHESFRKERKDRPYLGSITFSLAPHSLISLEGYTLSMFLDEIPAYRKTAVWLKKGIDNTFVGSRINQAEHLGEDSQVFIDNYFQYISALFMYREASRSGLLVINKVIEQFQDQDFKNQISYQIYSPDERASSADIPILDNQKHKIGNLQIDLVHLAPSNASTADELLMNYLHELQNKINRDYWRAEAEIDQIKTEPLAK